MQEIDADDGDHALGKQQLQRAKGRKILTVRGVLCSSLHADGECDYLTPFLHQAAVLQRLIIRTHQGSTRALVLLVKV